MDLIVGIEKTKEDEAALSEHLSKLKYKSILINFLDKAEEYVRSARPKLILMAYEPNDKLYTNYLKKLKQDPITREVPVIALVSNPDNNFMITYKRIGFIDFLVKPLNQRELENKIQLALKAVQVNKISQKPIEIQRSFNRTAIVFNAGLTKYVLPEIKNILTAPLLKAISSDKICIDIRNVPNLLPEEVIILERLLGIFGQKKIAIITGRYMGLLISQGLIPEKANLFMSMEEFEEFSNKKPD